MANTVKWLIQDRIIIVKYTGYITTDDVIETTTTIKDWLKTTSNTVHAINDLTESDGFSPDFQKVGQIFNVTRDFMKMDNLGMMAAYGTENQMMKFVSTVVGQLGKANFRMFDTYNLTVEHIMHNEPELRELLPSQGA